MSDDQSSILRCFQKVTKGTKLSTYFASKQRLFEPNITYRMVEQVVLEMRAYYPVRK